MYYFSISCRCKTILWLAIAVFGLNCGTVLTQPPHARAHYVRGHNSRDHSLERQDNQQFPFESNRDQQIRDRQGGQHFPFGNNPGQQILDRLKSNFEANSNFQFGNQGINFGKPFGNNFGNIAQQAAENTFNILNKNFQNLNQFSMGNFGNFNQNPPPNNHNNNHGVTTLAPDLSSSAPIISTVPSAIPNENIQQTTTSKSTGNNITHYIGNFPVIPLKPNEIR